MSCVLDLSWRTLCDAGIQPYYTGDDWSIELQFPDANGDPIPILGSGMSFKATISDGDAITLVRDSADSAEIELLTDSILLKIARTETTLVGGTIGKPKEYRIDVVRIGSDSSEQTWAHGKFEAVARITA